MQVPRVFVLSSEGVVVWGGRPSKRLSVEEVLDMVHTEHSMIPPCCLPWPVKSDSSRAAEAHSP